MATVKTKFRASSSSTKEGTLFYQVIHKRVPRQIHTGYKLYPQEWDAENKEIVFPPGIGDNRRNYLVSLKDALRKDIKRLKSIISRLERADGAYTAEDVVESYLSPTDTHSFISFAHTLVGQLKQIGKQYTAYETAINSFTRFRKEQDVPLDEVDSDLMMTYEAYLKSKGICPNSSSFYMRNLRAIYNRAVDKELTEQRNPFKHVYTGIDKTVKRAVPLSVIRQIRDLDLNLHPAMDYARNIFMFSFYTRGMSFIDMAFLKKKDLQNGVLSYRRHKTNQQLFIKWEKPMQELIDKFDTSGTPYLLPIIKNCDNDARKQYKSDAHRVNQSLKKIGKMLGLAISLTSYVARHSWASIAKSKNIPIATISEAMGHDSENTTRIYLASLDTTVVDKANSLILKSL
ncbi:MULTISPECIES: tyrosine-type recombinase/integrase [Bacteroidaceae]|jgi:transposase|uniref:tyrosine-type recombinase/integrase n=1 Tax=Bacteroidaceae TaxID=815 RepID=UPI00110624CD|nr:MULTISPECIES: site-specific integrase [Bacteroidaceae]MCE9164018.1 site-specific integrase [Bacteroides ovatus]MDB1090510.1 site-specific integrase [Phocaeicola vulgatus]